MKLKNFILIMFVVKSATAQNVMNMMVDLDYEGKNISLFYDSGASLIYNCEGQHYACVSNEGLLRCQGERIKGLNDDHQKFHLCAPIKKYENYEDCKHNQQKLIEFHHQKIFCWKK